MSAALDPFRSSLSLGLHAAAQPLAILRSWFDPIYNTEMTDDELREMVTSSTEHVDRLCTLFGYLQHLVGAENIDPTLTPSEISPILEDLVEGVELWFGKSEINILRDTSDHCDPVLIDKAKMRQVLSTVLMVMHRLSAKKDVVELTTKPLERMIQVTILNANLYLKDLDPEAELGLAAAKTTALKQHCQFTYSLQPLTIKIDIPKATSTR